ncbi:MAG: hypothetical protein V7609_1920 [Verrucomicrobiota bacterium]
MAVLALGRGPVVQNVNAGAVPEVQSASPIMAPKPAASAQLEGSLDIVEVGFARGWAWDASHPETPIQVEIYDGKTLLGAIIASEFREDLKKAGKGDGKHAFNYPLAATLRDGQAHTISIRFVGSSTELPGSPKTLLFPKL